MDQTNGAPDDRRSRLRHLRRASTSQPSGPADHDVCGVLPGAPAGALCRRERSVPRLLLGTTQLSGSRRGWADRAVPADAFTTFAAGSSLIADGARNGHCFTQRCGSYRLRECSMSPEALVLTILIVILRRVIPGGGRAARVGATGHPSAPFRSSSSFSHAAGLSLAAAHARRRARA